MVTTTSIPVRVIANKTLALELLRIPFMDEFIWARVGMTQVLRSTAVVEIGGSAIVVFAVDLIGGEPVGVAWRTSPSAALALRCATGVEILRKASSVDAKVVYCIEPLDRVRGTHLSVATSAAIATFVRIARLAKPIFAKRDRSIDPVHVLFRATVGVAMPLFYTTHVVVGLFAGGILAEDVVGVVAVLETGRARQAVAFSLSRAAR